VELACLLSFPGASFGLERLAAVEEPSARGPVPLWPTEAVERAFTIPLCVASKYSSLFANFVLVFTDAPVLEISIP